MNAPPAPTQRVDLPAYSSAPHSLITTTALQRNGWTTRRAAWIVETVRPLTSAQIKAAREAAADVGLEIEVRDQQDGLAALRTGATTVGALLALAIVAMALGLIRSESARDLATLTATGAAARTRRALTASTAAALAIPGVVLGTVGAYIALVAAFRSDLHELGPLPLRHLLALAVGLPLAALVAGWLLAGREPAAFARRQLD
jgi:putative ABC transport system permease protein